MKDARTDWSTTSYSELSTLAKCEQQWHYKYRLRLDDPGNDKMALGTLFHAVVAHWRLTGAVPQLDSGWTSWLFSVEVIEKAQWLAERYARTYDSQRPRIVASEMRLEAAIPGSNVRLVGRLDELWEFEQQVWAVERKTYGDRGFIDLLDVNPQLTLYDWLLRENGYDIYGVVFDGAYTYQWKPDKPTQQQLIDERLAEQGAAGADNFINATKKDQREWAREAVARHPGVDRADHESFDQVWTDRNALQREMGLKWARAIINRRSRLVAPTNPVAELGAAVVQDDNDPIRNIGPACKGCPYKTQCFEEMAFPQEFNFELELG